MPSTWTYMPTLGVEMVRDVDRVVASTGGGHYYSRISEPAYTQSDGQQGSATYRGHHTMRFPYAARDIRNDIDGMIAFLQARIDEGDTSFYAYNTAENDDTTTWTGDTVNNGTDSRGQAVSNTTGRYLMKNFTPIKWVQRQYKYSDFVTIEFVQDHST